MNTQQTSQTNNELISTNQHEIIKSFFQTDSANEMIESLHFMAESLLFNEDLKYISSETRVHLVNQLRVASLVAKLDENRCKC
ncbi:hypothetical protein [Dyadobacter sp. MSC1_007]|jgi:hypothetical protein|uniref:hypothetical protein n=1 Tax=Dyadobacter sp. MSC1_007 TaxID=2909264 RepID=UPI00202EAF6F|nr:hypothetical protein [Dyadobacter sp. MSC1_007]